MALSEPVRSGSSGIRSDSTSEHVSVFLLLHKYRDRMSVSVKLPRSSH